MEKLKKLLEFLSPLPAWLRVVIAALVTVVVSICVLMTACTMASSCGITQSVVNNFESDGNTIEMGVTPSTTTSTTASPEIPINAPLKNSMWAVFLLLNFVRSGGAKVSEMHRLFVDADSEDDVRIRVSDYYNSPSLPSTDFFDGFDIHAIVRLPSVFYCD